MKSRKWLFSLLAVFVAVLGLAVASACRKKDKNVTDGSELGVYYYDGEGKEYLITLADEYKFGFVVRDMNTFGTYKLEGETLTLDFDKKNDGSLVATLKDDVLTLTYDDAQMRFLKKVAHTVTFDVDGGSKVDAASVVNGKTTAKPADPSKKGYVFLGWYADAEHKTAFDFDSTIITADTTVYAYWAKEEPGEAKYTVDFDLGYDAEEVPAPMQTIGGKLYKVPEPERAGHTFAGWWISDYEEASKLTYLYTTETEFHANTTLFALWETSENKAPLVSVDANGISWESMGVGTTYTYSVEGPKGFTALADDNTLATKVDIKFADAPAGDYVIKVSANGAETERHYRNKSLDRVSLFSIVEPSVLLFTPVEHATKYYITVDCGNDKHVHTMVDNSDATYFNFAGCPMQEGGIVFTVTATADGYASSVSEPFAYDRKLEPVGGFLFEDDTQTLSWNRVPYATNYLVSVKFGDGEAVVTDNGARTSFSLKEYGQGKLEVKVTPATDGYNSPEASVYSYEKKALATPDNVRIEGTVVKWDAVKDAQSYTVRIGSQTFPVEDGLTQFDLKDAIEWTEAEDYELSVRANGAANSAWSDVTDIRYNAMYAALSYARGTVTWRYVVGAEKYEVKVNDGAVQTVVGKNYADVTLTTAGVNTIYVRFAEGKNRSQWAELEVTAYEITFDTLSGVGVAPQYKAVGDPVEFPATTREGFTFSGWYSTPFGPAGNAASHTDDKVFTGTTDTVLYAYWTPKHYQVRYNYGQYGEGDANSEVVFNAYNEFAVPTVAPRYAAFAFYGWYAGMNGEGKQYTDENGEAVCAWDVANDDFVLYAYWVEVFSFAKAADGNYAVKAGSGIKAVDGVKIPMQFDEGTGEGPKLVSTISANAFKNVTTLKSVSIPNTIRLVDTAAFSGCTELLELTVYEADADPDVDPSYWDIDGVLMHVSGDQELGNPNEIYIFPLGREGAYTVPDEIEYLPLKAFAAARISEINISASVENIASQAFLNCKNLNKVTFLEPDDPESAKQLTLGSNAFKGCTALTSINIPARAVTFSTDLFTDCTNLEKINIDKSNENFHSIDGVVVNADEDTILYVPKGRTGTYTIPLGITTIEAHAFDGCKKLTEVQIPGWVTEIKTYAFRECSALETVKFLGGATSNQTIGTYAFYSCHALETVEFAADCKVTVIGKYAFGYAGVTAVTLPASLTTVEDYAFYRCASLGEVRMSGTAQDAELTFGKNAFEECVMLTDVYFSDNVKSVASNTFIDCVKLAHLHINPTNPNITVVDDVLYGKNAEGDLTSIMFYPLGKGGEYVLPDKITEIANATFMNNAVIEKVTLGAQVTKIGSAAFQNCTGLTQIVFLEPEEGVEAAPLVIADGTTTTSTSTTGGVFAYTSSLETIELPARTTSVGKYAFYKSGIGSVTVKKDVTYGDYAFSDCEALTTVTIEQGVSKIPDYMFQNCASLETITIPSSVREIGAYSLGAALTSGSIGLRTVKIESTEDADYSLSFGNAVFNYARSLETVNIPRGTTRIGMNMFMECNSLKEITFPNTVTEYGASTAATHTSFLFTNCSSLETITFEEGGTAEVSIPDGMSSLGGCFTGCIALKEIRFPSNLVKLGSYAFAGTTASTGSTARSAAIALQSVTFGGEESKLKEVGTYAFSGCIALTSVEFPKDLGGSFGLSLFNGCTSLEEVTIPEKITSLGNSVFSGCTSLQSITIPASVTSLGNYVFSNCSSLESVTFAPAPEREPLTLGTYVFQKCVALQSIEIPAGVTKLGNYEFDGCLALNEVTFPDTITEFGNNAFSGCAALESVKLPAGLTKLGNNVFLNCTGLTSVEFPAGLTTFGTNDFAGCTSLNTITVSAPKEGETAKLSAENNVLYNGDKTQILLIGWGITGKVTIPNTVTKIGAEVFALHTGITEIEFQEGGEADLEFGDGASATINGTSRDLGTFAYLNLTKIKLPARLKKLGKYAFSYCEQLESVTFEDGLRATDLGQDTFYHCAKLKSFTIPATVTKLDNHMFQYSGLTSIEIPASVQTMGTYVFDHCSALATVKFAPDCGVTALGNYAFNEASSLREITLPDGLTGLGSNTFTKTALTSIVIPNKVTTINWNIFSGTPLAVVTLPDSLKATSPFTSLTTYAKSIKEWKISENAANYKTVDGVLYTKDGATLFNYPCQKEGAAFEVPADVTSISNEAFRSCEFLEKVTFAARTKDLAIGSSAFNSCKKLNSISLPSSLTSLGGNVLQSCSELKTVVFETDAQGASKLTAIPNYAFGSDKKLESITLPASLATIGQNVFNGCSVLNNVVIPKNVTSIGNNTFQNCTGLTTITFEKGGSADLAIGDGTALTGTGVSNVFVGTGLTALELPARLTKIGNKAFTNIKSLKTVTFEEGCTIETMKDSVFAGCTGLTTVTNLPALGKNMFDGCTNLKTCELPETITEIPDYAFRGTALEEVEISGNVTTIGKYAYANNAEMTTLDLSTGLESIGDYAFQNCTALSTVTIPGTVTTLGANPFEGVPSLALAPDNGDFYMENNVLYNGDRSEILFFPASVSGQYDLPESVLKLGAGVFAGSNITGIKLHDMITEIPDGLFKGSKLQSITIGRFVTKIGAGAFENCTDLNHVEFQSDRAEDLTIGANAFRGCTALTQITLSDSVKTIADNLFENSGLTSFACGDGVTTVGASAFKGTKLTEFTVGTAMSSIGAHAFEEIAEFKTLTFTSGGKERLTIGDYAFASTGIQSLKLPFRMRYSVSYDSGGSGHYTYAVGNYAFQNCTSLATLEFEESGFIGSAYASQLFSIGNYAFAGCSLLQRVDFPKLLGSTNYTVNTHGGGTTAGYALGKYAFQNCTNLEHISFKHNGKGEFEMDTYVFEGCEKLDNVELPVNLVEIPAGLFKGTGLTKITTPQSVDRIGERAFENCTKLQSVTIPSLYKIYTDQIGKYAFAGCTQLQTVELPQSSDFKQINEGLFQNCTSLANLQLPATVQTIQKGAFENCTSLMNFEITATMSKLGADVFKGWKQEQTITVPYASKEGVPSTWDAKWDSGCNATFTWKNN